MAFAQDQANHALVEASQSFRVSLTATLYPPYSNPFKFFRTAFFFCPTSGVARGGRRGEAFVDITPGLLRDRETNASPLPAVWQPVLHSPPISQPLQIPPDGLFQPSDLHGLLLQLGREALRFFLEQLVVAFMTSLVGNR